METLSRMPGMTLTLNELLIAVIASLPSEHRGLELDYKGARKCCNVIERLLLEAWQPSSPRRGDYIIFDPVQQRAKLLFRDWEKLIIWLSKRRKQ